MRVGGVREDLRVLPDLAPGTPVALVPVPGGAGLAWPGGSTSLGRVPALADEVRRVWWSAHAGGVLGARACWDLAAVAGLLSGSRRSDAAAVWAAAHGLPVPTPARDGPSLFDLGTGAAVAADGQLDPAWVDGGWAESPETARRWAELALEVQQRQDASLDAPARRTAVAESAAALLCEEMAAAGLPFDPAVAGVLLAGTIGPRPGDAEDEARVRAERDARVLRHVPGRHVDLRSPEQVRALLAGVGVDVPDTRSWRLEPYAAGLPLVADLLAWRKADRLATTYGWRWLDEHVAGGRLRGAWAVADGGAGRMTAGAGLHNMPAELRPAVRAERGHVLVGADLGQVEPRVLAVVSGDRELARAAAADDMYAPVAATLGIDRPAAKVAVLAAMYGQTSGAAGHALKDMDRAYGTAMGYLRAAEQVGRDGGELRTYGGRLLRFGGLADVAARGRYARNAVVQGAAAELFKAWAATVRAGLAGTGGEIVLCLHDELLLHVPAEESRAAQALLRDALARAVSWWSAGSTVRFVADVRAGASWPEVH